MIKIEIFGVPYLKKGSGIHIKKKNRGSFTKYCKGKVTQSCIDKAKRSGNSKMVKKAVFAENSRKWKHLFGGNLSTKEQALQKLRLKYLNSYGGGKHGGGGVGTKFSYTPEQQFELKKDTLWVPILQSYNEAFTNARKKGLKTFMFNGELKNTKLGNDPKALEAGANRFLTIGVIPVERTKEVKKNEEGAKIHKPFGHKSILDNGWQSTKELKKKRPLIAINANGGLVFEETKKPIDKKSLLTNKPKKKLVVKRLVNPTGMVNRRPIPGLLTNELVALNTKKEEIKKNETKK